MESLEKQLAEKESELEVRGGERDRETETGGERESAARQADTATPLTRGAGRMRRTRCGMRSNP